MTRSHLVLLAIVGAALASAPAQAGRPRGMQVLDRDAVSLLDEESIWYLTLLRSAGGQALLMDQSDASPLRVTPLGFAPSGSTWGSYTATPDGSLWGACSGGRSRRRRACASSTSAT